MTEKNPGSISHSRADHEKVHSELELAEAQVVGLKAKEKAIVDAAQEEGNSLNDELKRAVAEKDKEALAAVRESIEDKPAAKTEGAKDKPETESGAERIRAMEVIRNVAFWAELGIRVDAKDVKEKINALPVVDGMGEYIYVPKGLKTNAVFGNSLEGMIKKIPGEKKYWSMMMFFLNQKNNKSNFSPRSNVESSYAIACKGMQEPDPDSLGSGAKSILDWEKSGQEFMQPNELIIANMMWRMKHGSEQYLDQKNATMCPGSRVNGDYYVLQSSDIAGGFTFHGGWAPEYETYDKTKVHSVGLNPREANPKIGVRRVMTVGAKEKAV